ncbi:AMP-binding protein [Oceanobacillus salinisoli]|uniref:AMP-binding protein n=1 Tax=Oceanobacillus salinisoli TaxID=2678611 RepID=UPI0012E2D6F2|nr:AMP-binding protein [Oceanobacillus salinisoli]
MSTDVKLVSRTIKYLLEKQSEVRGDSIYLQSANTGEEATFNEVLYYANKVGNGLNSLGINKGEMVATMIPTQFEAIYAWYGCAMIGAIEVPINNAYKGNILKYIINNSESKLLVIEASILSRIYEIQDELDILEKVVVIGLNDDENIKLPLKFSVIKWEDLITKNTTEYRSDIYNYDINHMLYTSGTTGPSKGVLCTFSHNYETAVGSVREEVVTDQDIYYNPLPINHIGGRVALTAMLVYGGKVVLRDVFRTDKFWSDIEKFQCTCTLLLGAMANFIYKLPSNSNNKNNTLKWLNMIPLIPEVEEFKKRFQVHVQTVFNMTEICAPITSDGFKLKDNKSCGKVRKGFEIRLVNDFDEEVPHGKVGELVVRSEKPWVLMAGYWKMPEKTVEAWRNQWLHTGDLFTRDEEGNFYFVDRVKDSIRRRGENISSMEVESEINGYPKVLESAAVAVPSSDGEEEIKACIVPQPNETIMPDELIKFLVDRMPHFMVPRYIEILEELPKTQTQKIQKSELRKNGITNKTWDRDEAGIKVKR